MNEKQAVIYAALHGGRFVMVDEEDHEVGKALAETGFLTERSFRDIRFLTPVGWVSAHVRIERAIQDLLWARRQGNANIIFTPNVNVAYIVFVEGGNRLRAQVELDADYNVILTNEAWA